MISCYGFVKLASEANGIASIELSFACSMSFDVEEET